MQAVLHVAHVTVLTRVKRIEVQCPSKWVTGKELICNVTIISGTRVSLVVDFKDGRQLAMLPDPCEI